MTTTMPARPSDRELAETHEPVEAHGLAEATTTVVAPETELDGVVIRAISEYYDVQTPAGRWTCRLRERARRQAIEQIRSQLPILANLRRAPVVEPIVVGDRVRIEPPTGGSDLGWIVAVYPRTSALTRRAAGDRVGIGQVLVANVDQIIVVFAAREPAAEPGLIDRFLVAAHVQGLPALLCLNKIDLGVDAALRDALAVYRRAGYEVLEISAREQIGVDQLRARLAGRISAVVGPSGVGKSTLLNAVQPGLGLKVGAVSAAVQKGRHTTRYAQLLPLDVGGYCVDTPGLREFGLWALDPTEIPAAFPEFRPYLGRCRFRDCRHLAEPDCAVRAAAIAGAVDARRYESYCRLRQEVEATTPAPR